jgi:hypothetical protein
MNTGDEIIMDAVRHEVKKSFSDSLVRTVPTHERLGKRSRELLRTSNLSLAGGTNLVGPPMLHPRLWKVSPLDALSALNVTLMGCGWRRYGASSSPYTRLMLRHILSNETTHAVRDAYTAERLLELGIDNVSVTGCPTTWGLTTDFVATIPQNLGRSAVVALNGKKDPRSFGIHLLRTARTIYDRVYFWPQMQPDERYLSELPPGVAALSPNLHSLDVVLQQEAELDYIGSRLHAGIRALQFGRRAFIFELDNRAIEMGNTLNLPTFSTHYNHNELIDLISANHPTRVRIPFSAIESWRTDLSGFVLGAS